MTSKFGHKVEIINNADLVIAQGAAVISELGWLPFLTKDIQIEMVGGYYWALFESNMPIASDNEAVRREQFDCVDQRESIAKIIVGEGRGQERDKILAILNVPVVADNRFGDEICLESSIDKDIILHISAYSRMASNGKCSIRKSTEVYKLCFGLDIQR